MQSWLGYTATWAGLVAAPSGVVALLISPLVGKYLDKFDARLFASIAFAGFAVSYFMRAGYTADASFSAYVMPLLVQGVERTLQGQVVDTAGFGEPALVKRGVTIPERRDDRSGERTRRDAHEVRQTRGRRQSFR